MTQIHHRCPECGERDHLYGRSDAKWSFDQQEWVVGDMEDQIECTDCDWSGSLEDTVYQDEDDEDPCPINRRPKESCPTGCDHGAGPIVSLSQIVQDVIERGKGGNDVEQYTIECARDKMTELIAAGLAETADLFATAMQTHIGDKPEPWPS